MKPTVKRKMNIFRKFSDINGRTYFFLLRKGISTELLYISSYTFQFALGILRTNPRVSH